MNISELLGKTLSMVTIDHDNDKIEFTTNSEDRYLMYHSQDCCERVSIEDINGDVQDLINSPITLAEEVSKIDETASESGMWTFYKLATIKGYVDIRWYGSSNGYYSERVDFVKYNNESDLY